jgi:hypothetical protein
MEPMKLSETDFFLTPLISNVAPVDISDIHFDRTFPDSLGFGFGDDPDGGVTFDGNVFGIGPGAPVDVVPDASSTLLLLGISLTGLDGSENLGNLGRLTAGCPDVLLCASALRTM